MISLCHDAGREDLPQKRVRFVNGSPPPAGHKVPTISFCDRIGTADPRQKWVRFVNGLPAPGFCSPLVDSSWNCADGRTTTTTGVRFVEWCVGRLRFVNGRQSIRTEAGSFCRTIPPPSGFSSWLARAAGWLSAAAVTWSVTATVTLFGPDALHTTAKWIIASLGGVAGLTTLILGGSAATAATTAEDIAGRLSLSQITSLAGVIFAAFLAILLSWLDIQVSGLLTPLASILGWFDLPAFRDGVEAALLILVSIGVFAVHQREQLFAACPLSQPAGARLSGLGAPVGETEARAGPVHRVRFRG